jgi:hypothetical protein
MDEVLAAVIQLYIELDFRVLGCVLLKVFYQHKTIVE